MGKSRYLNTKKTSPNAGLCPLVVTDNSEVANEIILAYKSLFGNQNGYKEPKLGQDGTIIFSFPNKGDAEAFFMAQANEGRRFTIVAPETNAVIGYSDGSGSLFHGDTEEFHPSDTLEPSNISKDQFVLPEPRSKLRR